MRNLKDIIFGFCHRNYPINTQKLLKDVGLSWQRKKMKATLQIFI